MRFVTKVTNGVIVIPSGIKISEGTSVRVEPLPEETLAKRLKHLIGSVDGLPPDFAEHHDHYVHRTPKK